MRFMGVDPGTKRTGLAVSDPAGKFARPLQVIPHASYREDARRILEIASEFKVECILIGQSLNDDGSRAYLGRQSARLAEMIRSLSSLPVILWDEALSTQDALRIRAALGGRGKDRRQNLDAAAAAVLLQSYLDSRQGDTPETPAIIP